MLKIISQFFEQSCEKQYLTNQYDRKKDGIPMAKAMSVILGLVFLAMGILGITNMIPMFTSNPNYVNIGEIVLGGLGLIIGAFSRK